MKTDVEQIREAQSNLNYGVTHRDVSTLLAAYDEMKAERDVQEELKDGLWDKYADRGKRIAEQEKSYNWVNDQLHMRDEDVEELEKERDGWRKQAHFEDRRRAELEHERDEARDAGTTLAAEQGRLQAEVERLNDELDSYRDDTIMADNTALRKEVERLKADGPHGFESVPVDEDKGYHVMFKGNRVGKTAQTLVESQRDNAALRKEVEELRRRLKDSGILKVAVENTRAYRENERLLDIISEAVEVVGEALTLLGEAAKETLGRKVDLNLVFDEMGPSRTLTELTKKLGDDYGEEFIKDVAELIELVVGEYAEEQIK